jgi:transposase InsO family protein
MAEKGNCYQNAIAERVNGILKNEFYLDKKFIDVSQARSATTDAILLDNSYRPHLKLNYQTPDFVHYNYIKQ